MTIKIYFDGACHNTGNVNPMGFGVVMVYDKQEIARYSYTSNELGTSNVAEWEALLLATQKALEHSNTNHYAEYLFFGDSKLIINQINERWSREKKAFDPYFVACRSNLDTLRARRQTATVAWIPRQENQAADECSKMGLLLHELTVSNPPIIVDYPEKFNRKQIYEWLERYAPDRPQQFALLQSLKQHVESDPYYSTGMVSQKLAKLIQREFVDYGLKVK